MGENAIGKLERQEEVLELTLKLRQTDVLGRQSRRPMMLRLIDILRSKYRSK